MKDSSKKLVVCDNCSFENDPENHICVSCECAMPKSWVFPIAPRPKVAYGKKHKMGSCRYCHMSMLTTHLVSHERTCHAKGMSVEDYAYVVRTSCSFCYEKIDHDDVNEHDKHCDKRK